MLAAQVNWIDPSDASGQRIVRDNPATSDDGEAAFAHIYETLLGLCDDECRESEASGNWLDSGAEGDQMGADDPGGLLAALNVGSRARLSQLAGKGHSNSLDVGYSGAWDSSSSMGRLMAQGREVQVRTLSSQSTGVLAGLVDTTMRQNGNILQRSGPDVNLALAPDSASVLNKSQLSNWMDAHALSRSSHHCAMYCRLGMEAAGLNTADRPRSGDAGDYGPFLLRHGAKTVPQDAYAPQVGDVVVFDKTDQHPNGHIEMYDGNHWVSDFMQHSFSPYRDTVSTPPFTIYRLA